MLLLESLRYIQNISSKHQRDVLTTAMEAKTHENDELLFCVIAHHHYYQ